MFNEKITVKKYSSTTTIQKIVQTSRQTLIMMTKKKEACVNLK